jgi:hypothetical protein
MNEVQPMEEEDVSVMPEDDEIRLDPIDQYLLKLIEELESEE